MNVKVTDNYSIWIDVYSDLVAGIKAFSQNLSLADIMSDGDWRLISADINSKLKVFKGPLLQNETKLQFTPVAISSFYAPDINSRNLIPYLAVASGPYIFVYKNLKGTFKFLIPNIEPNPDEIALWNQLKENTIDSETAYKKFQELANIKENIELSTRTLELISLKDSKLQKQFIEDRKHLSVVISNYVVCMTTLNKSNFQDPTSTSLIVIGTECGLIYIIDHSGSKIILKFRISNVPYQIVAYGALDIDYRINIATRNGSIYTIKGGELIQPIIEVGNKIVSIIRLDKTIVVGTIDNFYHSYYLNGNKNYSISLPDSITCMESLDFKKIKIFKGILIALKNMELRLYNEKQLLNVYKTSEPIFSMRFGKFGLEEDNLILISESGSLMIKSLNPANMDNPKNVKNPLEEGSLNVPKKTKLYLDLIEREREFSSNMNQVFQSDLVRLRHKTLDTYIKMLKIGNAPQNYSTSSKIKLTASLQGLGPNFKLNIVVDNTGEEAIYSTDLVMEYDYKIFNFLKDFVQLGILMPNVPIKYSLKFRNISENGVSGNIKLFVLDKSRTSPLITTTVKVPISEVDII